MIVRDGYGNYVGHYKFRGEVLLTKEDVEKGIYRMNTLIKADHLLGEIISNDYRLKEIYSTNVTRLITTKISDGMIKIFNIEITDQDEDLGLLITFKPHLINIDKPEIQTFINYLETDKFALLPRIVANKDSSGNINVFDMFTFDLVPKVDDEELLAKISNIITKEK